MACRLLGTMPILQTSDDPSLQRIYVSLGQENESAVYLSLNKISEMR